MTQQSNYCIYTEKIMIQKDTSTHKGHCSSIYNSQDGSNLNVHRQTNAWKTWYIYKKWCITHPAPVLKNLSVSVEDARDVDSIPGSGRWPGGGHGNPFQHSCLEDPMDRGAWWATVHRVTKSWTWLKHLSTHARRNETRSYAETWKDLESGIHSKVTQKDKDKYIFTHMCGFLKNGTDKLISKAGIAVQTSTMDLWTWGWEGGWGELEDWDWHTAPLVK